MHAYIVKIANCYQHPEYIVVAASFNEAADLAMARERTYMTANKDDAKDFSISVASVTVYGDQARVIR